MKWSSWLVRLLCLGLVPVLVFTTEQTARAATFGDALDAAFTPATEYGTEVDCSLAAFYAVEPGEVSVQVRGLSCSASFNVSSANLTSLTVRGDECSFAGAPGEMDGTGSHDLALMASGFNGDDCVVTELCYAMMIHVHSNPWSDDLREGCVPFALGAPPDPVSDACGWGTPSYPWYTFTPLNWPASAYWNFKGSMQPSAPAGQTASDKIWARYAVYRNDTTQALYVVRTSDRTVGPTGPVSMDTPNVIAQDGDINGDTLMGYGLMTSGVDPETGSGWPQGALNQSAVNVLFSPGGSGYAGTNNPDECRFYWGEKVVNDPNSEQDDPAGTLTTSEQTPPPGGGDTEPVVDPPAPVEDPGCEGFSFTDPASWASAGICAVVRALMWVVDVLGQILGVLGGLVQAILDGLVDLFVPSEGFLDGRMDQLRADFSDTMPGAWLEAFTSQTYGLSDGGCGGVPVEWSIEGQTHSFNLLAACSGAMATAASVVKLAASAALVFFGGLACLRGLGSGFGWSPTIGRKGDGE